LPEIDASRTISAQAEQEKKMTLDTPRIDSESVGDPLRYRSLEELEKALEALPRAPTERGCVALIVARAAGGRRESPDRVRLEADAGVPGDAWGRQQGLHAERAITVMQFDVAELIANGQPLALFGDNLFLTLDMSTDNLPPGSRVRAGGAVLEVTAMPHNGCRKFRARFGADAQQLVSKPELRHRNLRGIYMRTVEGGEVAPGDPVEVIARAPLPASDAKPPF
jgi:MOSC domain-containing protein YiiM